MDRGIPLGRLFGTDIFATGGFFLLLALYFFLGRSDVAGAAVWCIAVVVSLLVHEFGHVFAVRRIAGGSCWVQLWMLGGLCVHAPIPSRGKQIVVSLMGPAFGFVLAGASLVAARYAPPPSTVAGYLVYSFVWINLVWNALNLLPIWPLDGGQALRAALAAKLGSGRAVPIVRNVSLVIAAAVALVALRFGFTIGVAIAVLLGMENLMGRGPIHD
jgi:Zn-dependent protease